MARTAAKRNQSLIRQSHQRLPCYSPFKSVNNRKFFNRYGDFVTQPRINVDMVQSFIIFHVIEIANIFIRGQSHQNVILGLLS